MAEKAVFTEQQRANHTQVSIMTGFGALGLQKATTVYYSIRVDKDDRLKVNSVHLEYIN